MSKTTFDRREILAKARQSPLAGKRGKSKLTLIKEQALQRKADDWATALVGRLKNKIDVLSPYINDEKAERAPLRDVVGSLDTLIKNSQLLSGRPTQRTESTEVLIEMILAKLTKTEE